MKTSGFDRSPEAATLRIQMRSARRYAGQKSNKMVDERGFRVWLRYVRPGVDKYAATLNIVVDNSQCNALGFSNMVIRDPIVNIEARTSKICE